MKRPRLVVFDLDGTLIDSVADLATALNETLRDLEPGSLGLPLDRVRSFVGEGARRLVSRGLDAAGIPTDPDAAVSVFMERYSHHLLDTTRFYPGVEALLRGLAGRRLAVLTNKPGGFSRAILEGLGGAGHFFAVIGGDDGARKPDPAGLLRLCAAVGAAPREAVLVGDSAIDVRTARAASVPMIGVSWGLAPAGFAADPPDFVVHTPAELLAALGG